MSDGRKEYVTLEVRRGWKINGKVWCGRGHLAPDRLVAVAIAGRPGDRGAVSDTEDYGPWALDLPAEAMEAGALLMAAKHGLETCGFLP